MLIASVSPAPRSARPTPSQVVAPAISADDNMGQGHTHRFRDSSANQRQLMRLVVEAQMLAAAARDADTGTRIAFDVARTLGQVDRLGDGDRFSTVNARI